MRVLLCLAVSWMGAAQPVPLATIQRRLAAEIAGLANYKCTEAVARERRPSEGAPANARDSVRLDVAYIGNREIYSWPDGSPFEEDALERVMQGGTMFSGLFASFARTALTSPLVGIRAAGTDESGRFRFVYEVGRRASDFTIGIGKQQAVIGYRGAFAIDAATRDLTRLEVLGAALPPELGLDSFRMTVDYARRPIGKAKPLLPLRAEVEVRYAAGQVNYAHVVFENCRAYDAESAVHFEEPVAVPAAASGALRPLETPVRLTVALDNPVQLDTCAAGDTIRASLVRPAMAGKTRIAEAGAVLEGRIERIERRFSPPAHVLLTLGFHTLESRGLRLALRSRLERIRLSGRGVRAQVLSAHSGGPVEYVLAQKFGVFTGFADVPASGLLLIENSKTIPSGTVLYLRCEPR